MSRSPASLCGAEIQGASHRATRGDLIRDELGYTDTFDTATALAQTIEWLMAASEAEIGEVEAQLGDRFDYAFEDALLDWWRGAIASSPSSDDGPYTYSHIYRHPTKPGEGWRRV